MPAPMLIPQPKISCVRDIEKVLSAETHTRDEIKQFKKHVRTAYLEYLDWSIPTSRHNPEELDRFKQHILECDMKMCRYLLQWPILAYANYWAINYRNKRIRRTAEEVTNMRIHTERAQNPRRRKRKTRYDMEICEGTTVTNRTPGRRESRIVTFVGKPPPHLKVVTRCPQEREVSTGAEIANKSPQILHADPSMEHPAATAASLPERYPLDSETPLCPQVIHPRTSGEKRPNLKHYPSPCAYCGYLPTIPNEIRFTLLNLFCAVPHVVPILAKSGLVHDRHLEIFSAWNPEDRQEFCDRLPRSPFSALDIAVITDLLVNLPYLEPTIADGAAAEPAMREVVESSPWPDDATKALLMGSPNFLSDLQYAMRLDDNEALFSRMIDLSSRYGKEFLQTYKRSDQASRTQLRKAVHLILEEEPRLLLYEDAWPIRIYFHRRVKDLAREVEDSGLAITMTHSPVLTTPSTATRNTQDVFDHPLIMTHSGCPVHSHLDSSQVTQVVMDFFGDRGMQELVKPLAANGVVTENQLALLCSLTLEQRENLVTRTDHDVKPILNLFQRILLKIALRP